jgi:dienelactone hydrolase
MRLFASVCLGLVLACPAAALDGPAPQKGTVQFKPAGDQANIPERYRLEPCSFNYELTFDFEVPACDVTVQHLTFPSPVRTAHPENNTVHAEYYRPAGPGPFPAVIVLDITGGDQTLSRSLSTYLAQNRIAGLFVQMAYYGPRRPAGSKLRLLSTDVQHTLRAVRQTVLDLRLATAWLESRPEVDAKRLGILGTSLGSLVGTLAAEMEPKLKRVAVLLGGGGLVDAFWDDPRARPYRQLYELAGGTKERLVRLLAPVDPLTCAANLKDRKVLMMSARRDEIIPPRMGEALWQASGRQKILWFDCTHYGGALYLPVALEQIVGHFGAG